MYIFLSLVKSSVTTELDVLLLIKWAKILSKAINALRFFPGFRHLSYH